jgi:hypothetical protein
MVVAAFPRAPMDVPPTALRRFGASAGDLDIEFGEERTATTDAVIATCTEPSFAHAAALPLSVRLRSLLRIVALETPAVDIVAPCACGEVLEISLPLAQIADDPARVDATVEVAGRTIRVPTGRDQAAFARIAGDSLAVRLAIARALAGDSAIDASELGAIEAALDAADPLVGFFVTATCPACGAAFAHDVDLEALAHRELASAQAALVEAVHRLALAYHWTERDVLALPPSRRAWYLALIDRGLR